MADKNNRSNAWHRKKRAEMLELFGNKCQQCDVVNNSWIPPLLEKQVILEFAHKIGFRVKQGASRGSNKRTREVILNPEQFLLFCRTCHEEYDSSNPQTEEERQLQEKYDREKVPF